ncbi:MAG: penicillin-binding protein 1C [Spirochaetes bacterium]|nr:penicillin-binding protein 1C [Spirochaetota bacterium]
MLFVLAIKSFRPLRRCLAALGVGMCLFVVMDLAAPLPRRALDTDYSTVYMDRNGKILRISLSPSDKYRIKLPLKEMSTYLKNGVLSYEDRYFYYHQGINPVSLARAIGMNIKSGRIVSGASTISMQVARMMERRPRTLRAKIIESFRALQLEFHYSKDEIMELYLNSIPMGGNIEGVGAGAYYYYGKSALELSAAESALLIGIPNSPNWNRPDRYPERARQKMSMVLERIHRDLGISKRDLRVMRESRPGLTCRKFPFNCPHLIESRHRGSDPFFVLFTVDQNLQLYCESIMKNYNEMMRGQGIYNGAVIIANNKTREVLAYVGSPDYFDSQHCGQINGAAIPRSPGSALKPFLYARAMELGLITPEKMVYDIPIADEDYSPANFCKTARGPVPARLALIHSLNVPAVRLEREMGGEGLKRVLMKIYPIKKDLIIEKSGLSIALGGFPLSLEDMVSLYMMLASNGDYAPLKYHTREDSEAISPRHILDRRACYIISEILSDCHRPDLPYSWEFAPELAKVALKTGTSFGLRDAWCIGYNPDYTVGVWLGNANNSGSSELIGVRAAAPLMIRILDHVTRSSDSWFKAPAGVAKRNVCARSGEKPGPFCSHGVKADWYIRGVSSEQECGVHKTITVRKRDGLHVCSYCMDEGPEAYEQKVVEYWPPEVISFMRSRGYRYSQIPRHNPSCQNFYAKDKPRIVRPAMSDEYIINEHMPLDSQKIPLKAFAGQDTDELFWFIGSTFLFQSKADETCFLTPRRGVWVISAVDSMGRSDSVKIKIY